MTLVDMRLFTTCKIIFRLYLQILTCWCHEAYLPLMTRLLMWFLLE